MQYNNWILNHEEHEGHEGSGAAPYYKKVSLRALRVLRGKIKGVRPNLTFSLFLSNIVNQAF